MFLSKATLLSAYTQLSGITSDPLSQGATQVVSVIRYFFALDEFVKKYGHFCDTQNKNDRSNFIECVDHVVSLYDNVFTINFYSSLGENLKSAIGSNLFSVNSVKISLENKSKEYEYPKRSGWPPVLVIKNGCLNKEDEYLHNITFYLNSNPIRYAFAVWLCRNTDINPNDAYYSIKEFLNSRYSTALIDILLPNETDFRNSVDIAFNDTIAKFDRDDFPKMTKDNTRIEKIHKPLSLDEPLQLIYYGAPGTGKSHTIDKATDECNSVRTTFHPDSDYAGFVGAYKPTMASMPVNAFVGTTVHHAKNSKDEFAFEKKIVYKYVPQAFLKAYVEAWKRYSPTEDNPYYLVIEEINRGNCAQIFGDLFQLLDRNNHGSSSYAISADQDIAQFLKDDENGFAGLSQEQRDVISNFVLKKDSGKEEHIGASILDGSKLLLPPNMRIWATMNTSDQSLFPIDSAFKRRWNWEYMPIEYDKKDWTFSVGGKRYSWGEFLKYINPKIYELTQSEDKQMGYFFAKPDKKSNEDLQENDIISTKVFVNKVLFYLWTDVFKDYDLTQEPFVYVDKDDKGKEIKKAYRFTDFFPIENNQKLIDFVDGMELPVVDEQEDDNTSKTEISGEFSVNGIPVRWQNGVPAVAVQEYIKLYPEKTAAEVIQDWRSLGGQLVSHFIETKAENEVRTDKDKDYVVSLDCNGETIFVSKQGWGDNRPNGSYYALLNLVNAIKNKGWNIDIKGVM